MKYNGKDCVVTLNGEVLGTVEHSKLMGDSEDNLDLFKMQSGNELLPPWAIAQANGELQIGAQLATRDGRRTGNAHIIDKSSLDCLGTTLHFWIVLTDAGNVMELADGEINEMFYPPKYVSDVGRVLDKFGKGVCA